MKKLTFMQEVVYDSIDKYIKENNKTPSFRKIALMAGLSSPATVHKHIHNLISLGYLEMDPKKIKSIKIVKGKGD